MRLRIADFAILGLSAAALVVCGLRVYGDSGAASQLIVKSEHQSWVYPMNSAGRFGVNGPLGETVVELNNGQARIVSSPCANQTCVAAHAISGNGQWIACLPNGVMISVEGGASAGGKTQGRRAHGTADVDGVSR